MKMKARMRSEMPQSIGTNNFFFHLV